MNLRQKHFIDDFRCRRLHALAVTLFDFRRATADQNHVLARLHGPRTQELNGRTFHHPVGRVRAGSNAAELNQSDGRQFGHTISSYDAEMI